MTIDAMERAVAAGEDSGAAVALAMVGVDAMRESLEESVPVLLEKVLVAGAEATVRSARARGYLARSEDITTEEELEELRAAQDEVIVMDFDDTNPLATRWAREHGSQLVTVIDENTRRAVRQQVADAIALSFEEGFTVRQTARMIHDVIGLTPRQDEVYNRIRAEQGEAAASRFAEKQIRARAITIARTETIAAANQGQVQLWLQAQRNGFLTGREKREWIVTPDDRLCPVCEGMAGQKRGVQETFDAGPFGNVDGPPAHPRCRCATGLVFDKSERIGRPVETTETVQ